MTTVKLDLGDIQIKNVMIDVDGYNLEEGVDVFYEGIHISAIVGLEEDSQSESDLEVLGVELNEYLSNK